MAKKKAVSACKITRKDNEDIKKNFCISMTSPAMPKKRKTSFKVWLCNWQSTHESMKRSFSRQQHK